MKISVLGVAIVASWSLSASAQGSAAMVQTTGLGELIRASESLVSREARYTAVRLPEIVSAGEVIPIEYERDGNTMSDSFMVTGIVIRDERCSFESKHKAVVDSALSDMIHAPCKKLR